MKGRILACCAVMLCTITCALLLSDWRGQYACMAVLVDVPEPSHLVVWRIGDLRYAAGTLAHVTIREQQPHRIVGMDSGPIGPETLSQGQLLQIFTDRQALLMPGSTAPFRKIRVAGYAGEELLAQAEEAYSRYLEQRTEEGAAQSFFGKGDFAEIE